jgi:S-adenosylmethionine synthetase
MSNISIEKVSEDPIESRQIELVERKGIGHPDSISDGIAESVSRALCKEYLDRFGKILHHNTDEVQLVAGSSNPEVGDGEVIEPIYILLTGRATKEFADEEIPVDRIALDAAKNYVDENFKVLSSEDIELESKIGETSTDLKSVFDTEGAPKSNDTSFGVGHAPLSETEKVVRNLERKLREELEAVGEDIKVMGLRKDQKLTLTVAAATICSRLEEIEGYFELKKEIERKTRDLASTYTDRELEIHVNTADIPKEGEIYTTVTGTSAEMGDDGSVGRGNRVNGLITPNRPMSMEAASGKNPVTHVGKIYNLLADKIAREIHEETGGFAEVKILSQIGKPIDEPQTVSVETDSDETELIQKIVSQQLENIEEVTTDVVEGRLQTF